MRAKPGKRRPWFSDDPPNPTLLRWVRGLILAGWAILLWSSAPVVFGQVKTILHAMPPGSARRAALEPVVVDSVVTFIALPFFALALFGYGIFPHQSSSEDGPPFATLWRSSRPRRTRSRRLKQDAAAAAKRTGPSNNGG